MYLDIAICLVVILGTLLGVKRGFAKTLKKSFILRATIAMMLCGVFAEALVTTSIGVAISDGLTASLSEVGGGFFTEPLIYINDTYYIHTEAGLIELHEALKTMPTTPIVKLVTLFAPMFLKGETGVSIIDVAVPAITKFCLLIIAYLLLLIIIRIVFIFINKLVQLILDKLVLLKGVDRLLGGAIALIKAVLFVLISLVIVEFVASMNFSGVELLVEQIENATIGKWLIDNNVLANLVSSIFGR